MTQVFSAEDGLLNGDAPVDAQLFVHELDASIGLGVVVVVALVLENGNIAEHGKAMSKTAGDEDLTMVVARELDGDMLTKGGGTTADVDNDIKNSTLNTTHELALRVGHTLIVEATDDTIGGHALVVLNELYGAYQLVELALREGLEEIATRVLKDARLYDNNALEGGRDDVHCFNQLLDIEEEDERIMRNLLNWIIQREHILNVTLGGLNLSSGQYG